MDNLTHSLVGVLLSRAGLNRYVRGGTALLLMSANTPDVDVLSYPITRSVAGYIHYHRGLTHAIIATPFMALLPVFVLWLFLRKGEFQWGRSYLAAIVGVASHWLLDWTNPYGIRLFSPFSDAWPALDATSVIDVWLWAGLLFATLWPMLARLVSSEIGAKPTAGRGWAITGLLFVLSFDTARLFLHARAVAVQQSRIYNGESPRRVLAIPTPFNPLVWSGIVETNGFWVTQTVNLASEFDPADERVLYKPVTSPQLEAARKTYEFRVMEQFSRALLWRVTPSAQIEGGTKVEGIDLRFGFTAVALVDAAGNVRDATLHF